jgi:hypothetical protein
MGDRKPVPEYSVDPVPRPAGWMYKSGSIGKWSTSWYASPRIQLAMVAFVCFLCPGMFNALGGLGGGGRTDPTLNDQMVRCSCARYFVLPFCPYLAPPLFSNFTYSETPIGRLPVFVATGLTKVIEHCVVQYLRRGGFLCWNYRQPSWRPSLAFVRWNRLLHLLH